MQRHIEAGRVTVNGRRAKAGSTLRGGDLIQIAPAPIEADGNAEPEDIPLSVLYEDDDFLVIDKPAGLVVHPAAGHWRGTLVNALLHRWGGVAGDLDRLRPGIVHRLDRDTSGVMAIGRTAEIVGRLGSQFRSRAVTKEYRALVWGVPRAAKGVVDAPIARDPRHRKRMAVRHGGRASLTAWEMLESFGDAAWLRALPATGRTHQIRVHLASVGHPLVGDRLYGRARDSADERLREFPRQALHAFALGFAHPRTGEALHFEAPLPPDLATLLAHLRARPTGRSPARRLTGAGTSAGARRGDGGGTGRGPRGS